VSNAAAAVLDMLSRQTRTTLDRWRYEASPQIIRHHRQSHADVSGRRETVQENRIRNLNKAVVELSPLWGRGPPGTLTRCHKIFYIHV